MKKMITNLFVIVLAFFRNAFEKRASRFEELAAQIKGEQKGEQKAERKAAKKAKRVGKVLKAKTVVADDKAERATLKAMKQAIASEKVAEAEAEKATVKAAEKIKKAEAKKVATLNKRDGKIREAIAVMKGKLEAFNANHQIKNFMPELAEKKKAAKAEQKKAEAKAQQCAEATVKAAGILRDAERVEEMKVKADEFLNTVLAGLRSQRPALEAEKETIEGKLELTTEEIQKYTRLQHEASVKKGVTPEQETKELQAWLSSVKKGKRLSTEEKARLVEINDTLNKAEEAEKVYAAMQREIAANAVVSLEEARKSFERCQKAELKANENAQQARLAVHTLTESEKIAKSQWVATQTIIAEEVGKLPGKTAKKLQAEMIARNTAAAIEWRVLNEVLSEESDVIDEAIFFSNVKTWTEISIIKKGLGLPLDNRSILPREAAEISVIRNYKRPEDYADAVAAAEAHAEMSMITSIKEEIGKEKAELYKDVYAFSMELALKHPEEFVITNFTLPDFTEEEVANIIRQIGYKFNLPVGFAPEENVTTTIFGRTTVKKTQAHFIYSEYSDRPQILIPQEIFWARVKGWANAQKALEEAILHYLAIRDNNKSREVQGMNKYYSHLTDDKEARLLNRVRMQAATSKDVDTALLKRDENGDIVFSAEGHAIIDSKKWQDKVEAELQAEKLLDEYTAIKNYISNVFYQQRKGCIDAAKIELNAAKKELSAAIIKGSKEVASLKAKVAKLQKVYDNAKAMKVSDTPEWRRYIYIRNLCQEEDMICKSLGELYMSLCFRSAEKFSLRAGSKEYSEILRFVMTEEQVKACVGKLTYDAYTFEAKLSDLEREYAEHQVGADDADRDNWAEEDGTIEAFEKRAEMRTIPFKTRALQELFGSMLYRAGVTSVDDRKIKDMTAEEILNAAAAAVVDPELQTEGGYNVSKNTFVRMLDTCIQHELLCDGDEEAQTAEAAYYGELAGMDREEFDSTLEKMRAIAKEETEGVIATLKSQYWLGTLRAENKVEYEGITFSSLQNLAIYLQTKEGREALWTAYNAEERNFGYGTEATAGVLMNIEKALTGKALNLNTVLYRLQQADAQAPENQKKLTPEMEKYLRRMAYNYFWSDEDLKVKANGSYSLPEIVRENPVFSSAIWATTWSLAIKEASKDIKKQLEIPRYINVLGETTGEMVFTSETLEKVLEIVRTQKELPINSLLDRMSRRNLKFGKLGSSEDTWLELLNSEIDKITEKRTDDALYAEVIKAENETAKADFYKTYPEFAKGEQEELAELEWVTRYGWKYTVTPWSPDAGLTPSQLRDKAWGRYLRLQEVIPTMIAESLLG